MADIFRQPLVIPRARQASPQQPDIPRNLLLTTLAVVVTVAPFVNRDQPNPVRRAAIAQQETSIGRLPSSIVPRPPFVQRDQPPPTRQLRRALHESSQGRLPNFPSMRIPGARELPQPGPARRVTQVELTPNLLTSTLRAATQTIPFRVLDQPNPTVKLRAALQPNHFRSSFDPGAPAAQPLPVGRLLDQPNPLPIKHMRGQEFASVAYTARPIELLLLPQHDFQNPTLARRVQQPQLYPNLLTSTLRTIPAAPFKQLDHPNPTLAKRINRGEQSQVLPLTTLYVPPAAMPVGRLLDQPNPLPIKLRDVNFTFDGTPLPNTIPPAIVPVVVPSSYVGGGGMGGGKAKWWDETPPKKKRKDIFKQYGKDVREAFAEPTVIRDVYAELQKLDTAPPDVAAFTAPDGATDWNSAARDLETVSRILQAWRAEERRREIADDDEEMMLF